MTDAFCRATLEAARPYIYVVIEEVKQGYWGLAGHPLPDPDFLINDLVPIFEDAADAFLACDATGVGHGDLRPSRPVDASGKLRPPAPWSDI